MSLLDNWFSRKAAEKGAPATGARSAAARLDARAVGTAHVTSAQNKAAQRRSLRLERRELLYGVIRESMLHAGVLSSTYKFKVLSLDPQGMQYLVMVDLTRGLTKDMGHLADIEVHMAHAAKARHDILVTAVYWRDSEHTSDGEVRKVQKPVHAGTGNEKFTAPLHQAVDAMVLNQPLLRDELAQKNEIAGAEHGQNPVAETGFADTELAALDERASPLSGTQYGDLK